MIGVLFSGQGSQVVQMGKNLYESYPDIRAFYDSIQLGFDIKEVSFAADYETLSQTQYVQASLVAFQLAIFQHLTSNGFHCDAISGLSLGMYSALAAAGVFTANDALKIVEKRSIYMAEASKDHPSTMYAILGKNSEEIEVFLNGVRQTVAHEIANRNCPGQIVVSVSIDLAKAFENACRESPFRLIALDVEAGFHSSFMKEAGVKLMEPLQKLIILEPKANIYMDTSGKLCRSNSLKSDLSMQVYSATNFQYVLENMIRDGVSRFVEIGNKNTFQGFLKKINRAIPITQINSPESMEMFLTKYREERHA